MSIGDEKRTLSESVTYKAKAHRPYRTTYYQDTPLEGSVWDKRLEFPIPNHFATNKFESFKICCGQCFNLDMTEPILAT